jgi:hypothetical protein
MPQTQKKKKIDANTENLTNIRKTKIAKWYYLFSEPSSDTNWRESHDQVVMQPTIKNEIWSWKAKRGLIGVRHNENLSQGTNIIGMKSNDTTKLVDLW